jgi:hypothetical protein
VNGSSGVTSVGGEVGWGEWVVVKLVERLGGGRWNLAFHALGTCEPWN